MYHSKILNRIKLDYFFKFVVHELNSEMVKSEMLVLNRREKANTDRLQLAAGTVVGERKLT
jgi:hypothetical protein